MLRRAYNSIRGGWLRLKTRRERQRHWSTAHRVLCVSDHVRALLVDHYGLDPAHADCIYPGVDFERFAFDETRRSRARLAWEIPPEARVVGSLGRLVPHKRIDLLLRAFAKLQAESPQESLFCVIVGTGPELDGLRQLAADLQIATNVRFVGWIEDSRDAYCGIEIFCMPSEDEGLGLVLIEAGACGCIPLAANAGGMPEVIRPLDEELIVRQWSGDVWAASIRAQLSRETLGNVQFRQQLRHRLQSRFDARMQWQRTVEWIERVMTERAVRTRA